MINSVELHITNACTHNCPYCYMNANLNPNRVKYMDKNVLAKIIGKLKEADVKIVALLGGDPALHPEIMYILQRIHDSGMAVSLMSNTMMLPDPQKAITLIDNIDVTLHGRNAKEHDGFCGCLGAFESLMDNLKYYNDGGVNVNIAVNITPMTYNKIFEIIESVINRGIIVNSLLTQRILPNGRAFGTTEWNASAEQVNIAFSQAVLAQNRFGIGISVEDPYPFCVIDKKYHQFMHGCPEGTTRLAIGMNGEVSRCGADPSFSQYNILWDSVDYIWNDSDLFKEFREKHFLPKECRECVYLQECGGGCPISCENCVKSIKKIWDLGV